MAWLHAPPEQEMLSPEWEWEVALRRAPPIKPDSLTAAYRQAHNQHSISLPQTRRKILPVYSVHYVIADEVSRKEKR